MEEQFDVINEQDEVIGQAARSIVHARGLLHRGVHIFLFTPDEKLIIHQRTGSRKQYPSLWDCSVSEHVKAGEDYAAAAQRGLWEELGIRGVNLAPLLRFRLAYGPNDNEISLLFTGTADPARVQFDPVEIARVEVAEIGRLLERIERGEMEFCTWFVQLLRWYTDNPSDLHILQAYKRS